MTSHESDIPFSLDSKTVQAAERLSEKPNVPISGDYIRDQADFIGKMATFFEALYQHTEADRIQYDFHFPPSILNKTSYPDLLQDRLLTRDLVSVKLSIIKNGSELATTSFEFIDDDGHLYASRDPEVSNSTEPDRVIHKRGGDDPIGRFTEFELDIVLQDLIGLAGSLERKDEVPTPGIVPTEWIAELQKRASLTDISAEHTLPSKRVVKYSAKEAEGRLQIETGSIKYETGLATRHIQMELDLSNGLSLKFYSLEDGDKARLIPDTGDIIRLTEIISTEQELITGTADINVLSVATLSENAIKRVRQKHRDSDA